MDSDNNERFNEDITLSDVNTQVQIAEEFIEFLKTEMNMRETKFKLIDNKNFEKEYRYEEFIDKINELMETYQYRLVIKNLLHMVHKMPNMLDELGKRLTNEFRAIITMLNSMNNERAQYFSENDLLKQELAIKDKAILDAERKVAETERLYLSRINELENSMAKDGKIPNSYFDNNIHQSVALHNDIMPETQAEQVEDVKLTKAERIQNAHEEILNHLKEEGYYPLHKTNPMLVKLKYVDMWERICFKEEYDLKEKDFPKFINNIDEYFDKPDNYLDIVSEVTE